METITVGFSKPNKWKIFAWLIMKAYNIPYDHVYVKFHSSTYDRDIIYQASKMMVNFMGTDFFQTENIIVDEFPVEITSESKIKLMQFAIDNAGKPYGIKEAFGMGIVRICELFGKKIKNPFADKTQTYVCSELAGYILESYAGASIPKDVDDITPLDVYNYLTALKK
jgi:hypothetical protein